MSEPLEIPDRAWDVASKIIGSRMEPNAPVIAAMRIAVAAELRRMAGIQEEIAESYTTQAFRRVAYSIVHRLHDRADELDSEGSNADPA